MTTTTTKSRAKTPSTPKKPAAPKAKVIAESIPELPANPFVFEILNIAANLKSNEKKVEALQK